MYTFPNLISFLLFALQSSGFYGDVVIKMDGTSVSYIQDDDYTNGYATLTGTAIIEMQPGQKVSDSLLFLCCRKLKLNFLQLKLTPFICLMNFINKKDGN